MVKESTPFTVTPIVPRPEDCDMHPVIPRNVHQATWRISEEETISDKSMCISLIELSHSYAGATLVPQAKRLRLLSYYDLLVTGVAAPSIQILAQHAEVRRGHTPQNPIILEARPEGMVLFSVGAGPRCHDGRVNWSW